MFGDKVTRAARLVLLGGTTVAAACTSMVVVPESSNPVPGSSPLRLATERGIKDVSTAEDRALEVPIQVAADSIGVPLPGCAARAFLGTDLNVGDFVIDSIREESRILVEAAEAGRPFSAGGVVVPPGERRLIIVTLRVPRSVIGEDEIGLRLDGSPGALRGGPNCSDSIAGGDREFVSHYVLPGIFVDSADLGLVAGGLAIILAILFTHR